jgi:hypothetical protein
MNRRPGKNVGMKGETDRKNACIISKGHFEVWLNCRKIGSDIWLGAGNS